jgi:hypothetical protein
MAKTRTMLIEEIKREVPFERLVAAMLAVLRMRREKAGWGEAMEMEVSDEDRMLDEFLKTCSVRQLKLLRKTALELAGGVAPRAFTGA